MFCIQTLKLISIELKLLLEPESFKNSTLSRNSPNNETSYAGATVKSYSNYPITCLFGKKIQYNKKKPREVGELVAV